MRTPGGYSSPPMKFTKPAKTYAEQLDLLLSRGLVVADRARAEHYLRNLNYYRLRAYLMPFEVDHTAHTLRAGTDFESVLALYVFDRALRVLIMDATERFEVALRTRWAYHLAHAHGPHAHLNRGLFRPDRYPDNFRELTANVQRSREDYVAHFREKYDEPLPPVWAVCEVMSLGTLSRWYGDLKRRSDRQAIARELCVDERVLVSFAHHLTHVRNLCAHHSRTWNRRFTFTPKLPRGGPAAHLPLNESAPRRLYNTLVLLAFFLDQTSPGHRWKKKVLELKGKCPLPTTAMGAHKGAWDTDFWAGRS